MQAAPEVGPGDREFASDTIAVSNQQESSHAIGTSLAVTSKERDLNCPNFNA
ncbi:MAG: hypothetical protein F6J93_13435 [Oscillatoria sp. SIO1A7]|nr:hypothetical protein [Oscillatoria sp. SIO1A7]